MDKRAETSVAVHDLIATRWSPRALDPHAEVPEPALRACLEAARWAPSAGNTQPARFLVGRRGDATFRRIFEVLHRGNKAWTHTAGALLLGVAVTENEKGPLGLSEYGLALAAENLVLQAVAEGLAAHQMAGFDVEAAVAAFSLPAQARPVVAIALGVRGEPDLLDERLRERELAPRTRLALGEVALGDWGVPAFD